MRVRTFGRDMGIIGRFAADPGCPAPLFTVAAQLNFAALARGMPMRTPRACPPCCGGWPARPAEDGKAGAG